VTPAPRGARAKFAAVGPGAEAEARRDSIALVPKLRYPRSQALLANAGPPRPLSLVPKPRSELPALKLCVASFPKSRWLSFGCEFAG